LQVFVFYAEETRRGRRVGVVGWSELRMGIWDVERSR
jgi:hypothetical protein